ncbi:MAG: T9SS type A sorting domain-containing protein [Ginsengibacter sp.]
MIPFTFRLFSHRKTVLSITTVACLLNFLCDAQPRAYSIVYSDNIKGGSAIFGNTLLQIIDGGGVNTIKMNDNSTNGNSVYGNNRENMEYADIDGTAGNGSVTRNSSSADLLLPAGTNTIKIARLYWGGYILKSEFDLTAGVNRKIKLRKGTSNVYADVTAIGIDLEDINSTSSQYQAYADVTEFIKNNGAGTYEAGNVPISAGSFSISGANGGWCIVVIYENQDFDFNSIRFYDGFQKVYTLNNLPSISVTLTGLNVPSGAIKAGDAKMGVVAWEGDANLKSDFLKINGHLFSNAKNPADNPWNGTITTNGVHVTTKNPNYTNQMGLDIDQFDVGLGYGISPGDNSINLEFGAEADRYFPGAFTFTIKMKDPGIILNKTVSDANNNNLAEANEVITYTFKGKNTGVGDANSVVITDTLPYAITYLPGSLNVIKCPGVSAGVKTDAPGDDIAEYIDNGSSKIVRFRLGTGSNGTTGGTLAATDSFEVEFKATVNDPGPGNSVPSLINIARIKAKSDANIDFVDDATAIINAEGGPLPVTLVSFTGNLLQDNKIKLTWATSMEINCSQYKVERSIDGRTFYEVATIAGNGTTPSVHSYSTIDDVSSTTGSVLYYRLKQMDLDKKGSFSKVIAVKIKNFNKQISISPNPFTNYLNINTEWNKNEIINVKVINVQGKEVIFKNIQMNKGLNYVSIEELSKLSAGNYFIQFISADERITRKITKE